jgi:hypothetical protein
MELLKIYWHHLIYLVPYRITELRSKYQLHLGGEAMIKGLTIFDKYSEKENNVTKSLIDLLRYSDVFLTKLLITEFMGISVIEESGNPVTGYELQVGTNLHGKLVRGMLSASPVKRKTTIII